MKKQYIHLPTFIGAFVLGVIVHLFIGHLFTAVYVYPSENTSQIVQDKAGKCFTYVATTVPCVANQIYSILPAY